MLMRTLRWSALLLATVAVVWTAGRAWGMGLILGQTKEDLKLKYDVSVEGDNFDRESTKRVTVVLTLADEGRLKPLDEVELVIPSQEKNKDGSNWMDLVVSIDMRKTNDGKRVGRVHIRKELAARAKIWLNTHTMDGKMDALMHDRDTKFTASFDDVLKAGNVKVQKSAFRSPNTVAFVERFIQTLQQECLDYFVVFGEQHMNHLVSEMVAHYQEERPHQAKENDPLMRVSSEPQKKKGKGRKESAPPPDVVPLGDIQCRQRLGGLLKHYSRKSA